MKPSTIKKPSRSTTPNTRRHKPIRPIVDAGPAPWVLASVIITQTGIFTAYLTAIALLWIAYAIHTIKKSGHYTQN